MIYLYTYLADIFIQIDLQMKTIEAFKTNKICIFLFIFYIDSHAHDHLCRKVHNIVCLAGFLLFSICINICITIIIITIIIIIAQQYQQLNY